MNTIPQPEVLTEQGALLQLTLYLGGIIVTGLIVGLGVIWRAYLHQIKDNIMLRDTQNQQDKDNLNLLQAITNEYKLLGRDVSRIELLLTNNVSPNIAEIKEALKVLHEKK